MNHKLKFYMNRNRVLSRREALQLLSDLPADTFEAKTYEKSAKFFWGVFGGLGVLALIFIGILISGWTGKHDPQVVIGLIGLALTALGVMGTIFYYRNQKDHALAQSYRNAHHVEKVLKLSEVIEDLIPPQLKDSIDLGFYDIADFQRYYQSLRSHMMRHMRELEALVDAEEEAILAAEAERQRQSDLNLMGREERGDRFLKVPPKQRALLEAKRKQILEGIYANEEGLEREKAVKQD